MREQKTKKLSKLDWKDVKTKRVLELAIINRNLGCRKNFSIRRSCRKIVCEKIFFYRIAEHILEKLLVQEVACAP